MAKKVQLKAKMRAGSGRGAAKRLRAEGVVPAVIYGAHMKPLSIAVAAEELENVLQDATSENVLVDLQVDEGGTTKNRLTLIQEVQHHPYEDVVLHIDFHEVLATEKLRTRVPVRPLGEPAGVKNGGGILEYVMRELHVECLPQDLPDVIEVNVEKLEISQSIHIGDITTAGGCGVARRQGADGVPCGRSDHGRGIGSDDRSRSSSVSRTGSHYREEGRRRGRRRCRRRSQSRRRQGRGKGPGRWSGWQSPRRRCSRQRPCRRSGWQGTGRRCGRQGAGSRGWEGRSQTGRKATTNRAASPKPRSKASEAARRCRPGQSWWWGWEIPAGNTMARATTSASRRWMGLRTSWTVLFETGRASRRRSPKRERVMPARLRWRSHGRS